MPSEYLLRYEKVGLVLSSLSTFTILQSIPKCIEISGETLTPLLTAFLDEREYRLVAEEGFLKLLDDFEATHKDVVSMS